MDLYLDIDPKIFLVESVKLGAKKKDIEEYVTKLSELPKIHGKMGERKKSIADIKKFIKTM
jgi:hypothetical protein